MHTHARLTPARGARLARRLASLLLVSAAAAPLALVGCTKEQKPAIVPGPPVPGLNLSGGFDCVHFGFMRLRQTGNTVQGTYDGVRNDGDSGTLRGKIEGDILWVDWVQPGNLEAAQLPKQGKAWLRILNRGAELKGRWGYAESRDDGGDWEATRSEFYAEER